jgi:hypothetical protein
MMRTTIGIISTESTSSIRNRRPGNRRIPNAKPARTDVTRARITVDEAMSTVLRNSRVHGAASQARAQLAQSHCGHSSGG